MSVSMKVPNWMSVLYMLDKGYNLHKISSKADITYAHVYHIISMLENKELIEKVGKKGRENVYVITDVGIDVMKIITLLFDVIHPMLDKELKGYKFHRKRN